MEELNNLITRMEEAGMSPDTIRSKLEELEATNPELFQEPEFPRQQPFTFNNQLQTVDQQDEPGALENIYNNIYNAFEEAFDVEIPDEKAETILTVGDAISHLETK